MSFIATPVPARWSPDSCTQCGWYRREVGNLCPVCADIDRQIAAAWRRDDPECKK